MANYKKITSLSLLTLLSLATFSATQYSKVYAQDPESSSSVNIKTIDGQLAIADKEWINHKVLARPQFFLNSW